MSDEKPDPGVDRRVFLKAAAAAAGATVAAGPLATAANAQETKTGGRSAASAKAVADEKAVPGDIVIARPGSDFMVDVLKALDFEYVAANPASSFRSLHESLINYGGNTKPELITCLHEETSVGIAHGYAKAAGKPMMVMAHGSVGLQHAAMAIYNAWCDRVPVFIVAGNETDASNRRNATEWVHSVQDAAALVRDFVKWDDRPASLQHFAESAVRAYRIGTTAPMEPTLLVADIGLQEEPIRRESELRVPKLTRATQAQGERAALAEAAKMLVAARAPVIVADRAVRSQTGVDHLVELAEALGAPVVDLGARMNFPSRHPLCHSEARRTLIRDADVVLLLEVADRWGQFNALSDPHKDYRTLAKPDVKTISIGMGDTNIRSNYQDFQRYLPIDLPITGEVEASLPMLIELVRAAMTGERRRFTDERAKALGDAAKLQLAREREVAAASWDLDPISTPRLAMELWGAIKDEPWSLAVSDRIQAARRLWPTTHYHQMLGASGGVGVGYGVAASVGVALANKSRGRITVTFQPDGDLLYAPGALWTAAHHRIPLLFLMHNNRAYHQEVMHVQRMAALHDRRSDRAGIGTTLNDPDIDFTKLAQSFGVWAEGPISDPAQLGPALKRALAVVKSGHPALIDAVCQPR